MAKRVPVTATGVALIALIAAAGGSMFLTQAEGAGLIADGDATVDTTKTEGDTALVTLTDAGKAKVPAEGADAPAPKPASAIAIDADVALPTDAARRGRSGGYPFEALEIGQSFHVAKTAENPDPLTRLSSSVSGARVKYSEEIPGEMETVTVRTYKRAEGGKGYAKDAEGHRILDTETQVTRPKTKLTRDFVCKAVDATDPRGEGARVWRVALA